MNAWVPPDLPTGARQRRQLGSPGPWQLCEGPAAGLRIPAAGGAAAGYHVDAGR